MHRLASTLLALALAGCSALRLPNIARSSSELTREDLRQELADYANHFHLLVAQAADAIHASTKNAGVRKHTLLWKIQVIPLAEEAAHDDSPQEAFVSLLTLTVMMRRYLSVGAGRDAFGEHQPLATEAARALETELLGIGTRFLGSEEMTRVQQEVEAFVASRPVGGREFALHSVRRTLANVEATSAFQRVVSVPLVPFRALEGVGDSASEIRAFNSTAREFVQSVERLPEQVRWQIELLLYDAEDRETTARALASFDALAQSAGRVSEATARLPADARSLLQDSSDTLTQLQQVIASARELAGPLQVTSEQIQQASSTWASILEPRESEGERAPGRPFDIREWESAVRELGTTAGQLERLLQELRATADSRIADTALAPVTATVERIDAATRAWIDQVTWRIAALLLAGFGLGITYRRFAR